MRDQHEPNEAFTNKLEWQIGRELRRRNAPAQTPGWTGWSRGRMAAAAAALVLVSMAIGGAAVAAAYESQGSQLREQLVTNFEQRLDLAELRLATVKQEFDTVQQRVSAGIATAMELLERRITVTDAEMQLQKVQLEIEEVRLTGREPRTELSAPLVSGRDFVSRRLKIELSGPERALELEKARMADAQKRFAVGVAGAADLEAARVRVIEAETALETLRTKVEIRQRFTAGKADAKETELRVLEADAEHRMKVLTPRLDLAGREIQAIKGRVEVGTAQQVELAEATLRRLEMATALSKAELDLALIRAQISKLRSGR